MGDRIYLYHLAWIWYPFYLVICMAAPLSRRHDRFMYRIANIRFRYKVLLCALWLYIAMTMPSWAARICLFAPNIFTGGLLIGWLVFVIAQGKKLAPVSVVQQRLFVKSWYLVLAACVVISLFS